MGGVFCCLLSAIIPRMLSRRRFLQFLGLAPVAIPAVVRSLGEIAAPVALVVEPVAELSALDVLNAATMRHIRRSPALVDGIFAIPPLQTMLKSNRRFQGGRVISDNLTFISLADTG